MVAAGLGVALVPELVQSFLLHPKIVTVNVEPAVQRHVTLFTWPDLIRVPAVRATIDALITSANRITAAANS
jgi:DNA-binding transcriptional LysR family regulator